MTETTGQKCITCASPERVDSKRAKRVIVHAKGCPEYLRAGHRTERDMTEPKRIVVPGLVTNIGATGDRDWRLFTFGIGTARAGRCVAWAQGCPDGARARMMRRFGRAWAFEYPPERALQLVKAYGLRLLGPEEIPEPVDLEPDVARWVDGILGSHA